MEKFKFTVDSALLTELGEKLVETEHLALIELVKNAYDADATEVVVRFCENKDGKPEIQIIDNGTGMTFKDVKNYWMRIATTDKVRNKKSPIYGRLKTGSKGIGRFCCRRLGNSLRLVSIAKIKKDGYEKTEVFFPWEEFIAGTEVTSVECPGKITVTNKGTTGTTLIINGGSKEEWNKRTYNYLKRQLAVLTANRGVRRDGYRDDPGFNILLDIPGFEKKIVDLREKLISAGWGTLTGRINKKGQAIYELEAIGLGHKKFISAQTYPNLQGVIFVVGILVDDRKQMRDTSVLSKKNLRKILPEWGGVHVRYNGFRVYPYGDDDWLDIDRDRGLRKARPQDKELSTFAKNLGKINPQRALLNLLSMRSHVGFVDIDSSKAKGFEMKANREGFIQTGSVEKLKKFVRIGIDWISIYREYYLQTKRRLDAEHARKDLAEAIGHRIVPDRLVDNAFKYIQEEIKNISSFIPPDEEVAIKKRFRTAIEAILAQNRANMEEMHHLRLITSTSTLTLLFSHEVKSLLGSLDSDIANLELIEKKMPKKDAVIIKSIRKDLDDSKLRFSDLLHMTSLIGVESKTESPRRLALIDRLANSARCFRLIIDAYDIVIDYSYVPKNIVVGPILEAELYAIILNILSNSIKSVIAAGKEKKIQIRASRTDNRNVIYVRDTGLGIDKAYYEDVFVPFVADPDGRLYTNLEKHLNPQDKYIVGAGSGLGLSIVREMLHARKGSIRFCEPDGKWKTKLEVILP